MNNTAQQARINISLKDLKRVTCPNCKNSIFKADSSIFKKLPGIQSPTGKAQLVQIPLLTCSACKCSFIIKEDELFSVDLEKDAYEA